VTSLKELLREQAPRLGLLVFASCCSCAAPAFADGMPFKEPPAHNASALDKAIDEIQNKKPATTAAPVAEPPKELPAPPPPQVKLEPPVPESRVVEVQEGTSFFGLSVGMYDPFTHGQQAASFDLQWEPGVKIAGVLQPLFGALATTNGALMGYGGIGIPFKLSEHIRLMPSVAVGAYHGGAGVDLHHILAWRGGVELAYMFDDKSRLGLNVHAITNGHSFRPRDMTEVIGLAYTMPFELFSGEEKKAADIPATPAAAPPPPAAK
jgi:lipid A 3-O-deacylase